jgi:hypothetical protein
MRVTKEMKEYIRKCVEKKVVDKLAAAEKAKKDQDEKDSKALKAVEDYAKSLIPEATKKVIAFAKKQGLMWFEHEPRWHGISEDLNVAFSVSVDSCDFEETNSYGENKSAARKMRMELDEEPKRIRKAVNEATNAIVFSLELGKVKKAELEELIASTEVEL